VRPGLLPVVPDNPDLRFQVVHTADVAEAYRLAALDEQARGAYNVAAPPVLDPPELARILGARRVPVPAKVLRAAAALTFKGRLQPTPPGWIDLAFGIPVMSTERIESELGWHASRTAGEALLELIGGIRDSAGFETPPLHPSAGGPLRVRELLTGVGRRNP